jgi:hypothetical protein
MYAYPLSLHYLFGYTVNLFSQIVIGNVDGVQAHNKGLIQMVAAKHDRGPETEALMGLANM